MFLGGVTISGTKHLDHNTLIKISGLNVGETLVAPGDDITQAVEKLWGTEPVFRCANYSNENSRKQYFSKFLFRRKA